MKIKLAFAVLGIMAVTGMGPAVANSSDDAKWVAQCQKDNSDAKVNASIVTKYCSCMTDKMPDSETRSVTEWEKSHHTERDACSKQAGWN